MNLEGHNIRPKSKIFPVNGEFAAETGSAQTASTTIPSEYF